ncbi:MAG: hypothetical protein HN396_04640 [Gemmatimonadales bacterium]|jgi:hypothetical protein|nr:hypothetical protein [Gemmatimonadales bacterium]
MTDVVREAQERCSGDASYRTWVVIHRSHKADEGRMLYHDPNDVSLLGTSHTRVADMRKTPYTDSEGKPIYEGDITELLDPQPGWYNRHSIAWDDHSGFTQYAAEDGVFCEPLNSALPCKVVGNVFENPELLGD